MTTGDTPEIHNPKAEIFREQALQAWRGQEPDRRVTLDLSPRWLPWALGGILVLAAVGMFLAATTSIPNRASSPASARLSSGGDSVLVDAMLMLARDADLRAGQTMSFRSSDPAVSPMDLVILAVVPATEVASDRLSNPSIRRVLVHGAVPVSRVEGGADHIARPGSSGTAHVLLGEESLLHMLRPRAPAGAKP